jgi:hypothetical protein
MNEQIVGFCTKGSVCYLLHYLSIALVGSYASNNRLALSPRLVFSVYTAMDATPAAHLRYRGDGWTGPIIVIPYTEVRKPQRVWSLETDIACLAHR